MLSVNQWLSNRLGRKAAVGIAMKYIIPLILGMLVVVFYLLFFGPGVIIPRLNETFDIDFQNI